MWKDRLVEYNVLRRMNHPVCDGCGKESTNEEENTGFLPPGWFGISAHKLRKHACSKICLDKVVQDLGE